MGVGPTGQGADTDGWRAEALVSSTGDMEARRRAEETVRMQASQYATMLATTADGFWRFDAEGALLEVNDAYCSMSGYSRAELLNLHVQDIEATETPEGTARHIQRIKDKGFDRFDTQHRRKDGSLFDVEISVSWWPQTGQFLHFCRDISERKRAEEKNRDDEARFRALVEQEIAGIFILASDGSITYVNPRFSEMLGYSRGEVLDRPLAKFIPESERGRVSEAFDALISGKQNSIQLETSILRKDGVVVDILGQGRGALHQGRPAVMGVALDITERKRAAEALRASHALLMATERIAGIGGWEWDVAENRVTWSVELRRIFGHIGEDPLTVKDVLAAIHPGDRSRVRNAIEVSLAQARLATRNFASSVLTPRSGSSMRSARSSAIRLEILCG